MGTSRPTFCHKSDVELPTAVVRDQDPVDAVLEPLIAGCEVKLLAKDGVYLARYPRTVTEILLPPVLTLYPIR